MKRKIDNINDEKSEQSTKIKKRFHWPSTHVKIQDEKIQGMLTKNNNTNSSRRNSSTSNSSSSSSSIDNNNNNNNKATMKSRTSFSVNTTTSETIAFEDEFNGLAGSISSSIGLPSDTLAAIQVLKQEFPKYNNLAVIPVMLEHHIYSIITDRTAGMKELDQLISDNILKKIYITTRDDDTAIIFVEDYKKLINDIIKKNRTDQRRKINILKIYLNAIDSIGNPSISLVELKKIYTDKDNQLNHIEILQCLREEGLLMKRCIIEGSESFWIAIPGIGKFCKQVVDGRKKIVSIIRRLPFREILELDLLQRKIKHVDMNIQFFIRDLIGSGKIISLQTTSGRLFRLPKKA